MAFPVFCFLQKNMMEILHMTEVVNIFLFINQNLLFIVVYREVGQHVVIFRHNFHLALSVKKRDIIKQTTSENMSLLFLG